MEVLSPGGGKRHPQARQTRGREHNAAHRLD